MKAGLVLALLSMLALGGCSSGDSLDAPDAGRTQVYAPGQPNFDMEVVPSWTGNTTGIDIYMAIPYTSLSFLQNGSSFSSEYDLILEIREDTDEKKLVKEDLQAKKLTVSTYDSTQIFIPFVARRKIDIDPGKYIVEITLEDKFGENEAKRAQAVDVIGLEEDRLSVSRVRMEGKDGKKPFEPQLALHLPSRLDSLRAVVEVYNAPRRLDFQMVLLTPDMDEDVADLPYWVRPVTQRWTMSRYVDYRRADTLQVTRRSLMDPASKIDIEFRLPKLDPGLYRIEITAESADGEQSVLVQRRDLSVKALDFPRITTLDEMVAALRYVAYDREHKALITARSKEDKLAEFERFWARVSPRKEKAVEQMRKYFGRAEESNLLFTSYKEGWKTDRGMVYIIMGPPEYVDVRYADGLRQLIWRYPPPQNSRYQRPSGSYGLNNDQPVSEMDVRFIFNEVRRADRSLPYSEYILRRDPTYRNVWEAQVNLWRTGRAL